jgi:hypothetical protein
MLATTLRHTEMARELTTLQTVASSITELVMGHSPTEAFQVDVANELVAEFQRLKEFCSLLDYSIRGPLTPSISPGFYGWTGRGGSSSMVSKSKFFFRFH